MTREYPRMVVWYSPRLLLKAAVEVVVSTLFGQHADQRTMQALTGTARISDYSNGKRTDTEILPRLQPYAMETAQPPLAQETPRDDFWFDYVADVGDGWDSTYSIAYLLTRKDLAVTAPSGKPEKLPSGKVLIFGGDQVYPTASRWEYDNRLLNPYQTAFSDGIARDQTDVYAIPGNHDWYDSLRSFSRIFLTGNGLIDPSVANTETPQTRSYFAIKLPSNWWILGTDVQLGSDIDANQLEYFRTVAASFGEDDKVILCTAEPHWMASKKAEARESLTAPTALDRLEQEILGNRVHVFVAGDVHHYMRYQQDGGTVQKITAGGGGAFLHPTHRTWERTIKEPVIDATRSPRTFSRSPVSVFPTPARSLAIAFRNWLFAWLNPGFGSLTAILYVVFALMMMPAFIRYEEDRERKHQELQAAAREKLESEFRTRVQEFMSHAKTVSGTNTVAAGAPQINQIDPSLITLWSEGNPSQFDSGAMRDLAIKAYGDDPRWKPKGQYFSENAWQAFSQAKQLSEQISKLDVASKEKRPDEYVQRMSKVFSRMSSGETPESSASPLELPTLQTTPDTGEKSMPRTPMNQGSDAAALNLEPDDLKSVTAADATLPQSDSVELSNGAAAETPADRSSAESGRIPGVTPADKAGPISESKWSHVATFVVSAFRHFILLSFQELALPDPFQSMLAVLVFTGVIAGFIAFTDIPNTGGRIFLGSLHGCIHWVAAYLITLLAAPLLDGTMRVWTCVGMAICGLTLTVALILTSGSQGENPLRRMMLPLSSFAGLVILLWFLSHNVHFQNLGVVLVVFVAGWLVGSIIMGGYLFLAHTVCGQHWNEAFSSIRCKDWKCFLRFRLSPDGQLTIFPIGVPRVCRRWKETGSHVEPTRPELLKPILIEEPITIRGT